MYETTQTSIKYRVQVKLTDIKPKQKVSNPIIYIRFCLPRGRGSDMKIHKVSCVADQRKSLGRLTHKEREDKE